MTKLFFNYLIFPGFLFSACVGLMACWVDRKVSARLQWRVGPPWYQCFMDIAKLFCKETILPEDSGLTFLLAPYIGLLSVILVSSILGMAARIPSASFIGDLIVVLYLLMIPAVSMIIGAFSSKNPFASIGGSREMKLVLGYELPFILAIIAVILKSHGVIQLGGIISRQASAASNIFSWSGAAAFIVVLLCMQAKLGLVPFDASEAEQEIMGGSLIEYSGLALAGFKLTRAVMFYTMPLFVIILFLGKALTPAFIIGKYILLLVIIILIKNTNPRVRVDQAVKFFWGPVTALAAISVILALLGK